MYRENESCLYKREEFQSKCLSEFTCQPIIDPQRGKRGDKRKLWCNNLRKGIFAYWKQRGYAHFVPKSAIHDNSLVIMKEFRINTGLINPSVFKSKINPNAQIRSYRKY